MQQGMQLGEALLLQRQLTSSFWRIVRRPAGQTCRRHACPVETWGDRVLDAASLDEVFGDTRH